MVLRWCQVGVKLTLKQLRHQSDQIVPESDEKALVVQPQENRSQGVKEHHMFLPSITLWNHTEALKSHSRFTRRSHKIVKLH